MGVVQVEQLLESFHGGLDVGIAGDGGLDVQDLAGFIESDAGSSDATALLGGSMFTGGLGLLVSFGEGAAEDPGSGDDDLGDDTVSL